MSLVRPSVSSMTVDQKLDYIITSLERLQSQVDALTRANTNRGFEPYGPTPGPRPFGPTPFHPATLGGPDPAFSGLAR